jgi:DNA mismatch repair protein MutL
MHAKDILDSIGFEIDEFGGQTVSINAVPLKFEKNNIEEVLRGLIEDLKSGADFNNLAEIEKKVLHYTACRSAIKFGQPLTHEEQVELIREMDKISGREYSCPHGRPTMILLGFEDLEREFKRRN